jgi:ABC-type multidrug transport system permease subunit
MRNMGFLGDFAKGFVIMTAVFWIFAIIELVYIKQIALATLFLIGLIIPLSMISYEYMKNRKKDRT